MLRQYLEVKAEHEDAVLFYRMGDFFELFFDDAVLAAPILEVALTARHKGTEKEVPMCGVPHHAVQSYIGKLLMEGYKVAICDQVEDPAQAKGLVRREVTRVVTPGTVSSPELLDGKEDNLLAALDWQPGRGDDEGQGAGAFLDVSTGTFFVRRWESAGRCLEDLGVERPREALFEESTLPGPVIAFLRAEVACLTPLEGDRYLDRAKSAERLKEHFSAATLRGFGLDDDEPAARAAAAALEYAKATQYNELAHVQTLGIRSGAEAMVLDATTLANLEIFRNQRQGGKKATLLSVLDSTVTAAGGRRLREWLRRPLRDPSPIAERHDAVDELLAQPALREELRAHLAQVADAERLLSRAVLGSLTPREASQLRDGLRRVPAILALAGRCRADLLADLAETDSLDPLAETLERRLVEGPPATLKDGGVIADGVDPELDRCRSLARDAKKHILTMEAEEREKTGISSLKIRYNKVFGYYLEVTKANQHLVPEHYIRKQTLVNAERYVTPEIKELEEDILSAEETQLELEEHYFEQLRLAVVAAGSGLKELASALATLDGLACFAELAAKRGYCRPRMRALGEPILVRDGRHPVVEAGTKDPFVPNDVELGTGEAGAEERIVVLTGPNMGGKSTYLRQVALIVLIAQAGSFVPARSAELGVVDRIFTRVGASDDLARGESTFMVEMIETANILHHATADSLVILDEVGRGTATFDGMSLAWAIVEHLHARLRPKTLFATHYHELTELARLLPGVVNRTMAVKEWEDKIVFLRRVVRGSADKSYGLHVARLAGLPSDLIDRASEVLANLEKQEYDPAGRPRRAEGPSRPEPEPGSGQLSLFTPPEQVVAQVLKETDLDELTPLAALNLLASLRSRLGG
ncbi:MAG: DNA mismatch repair protein MutS [Holophagales bacterium]|nr:DNA mismatch repair protein MutS [Holophagales bacterium]